MKVKHICKVCGKEYYKDHNRKSAFCSGACRYDAKRAESRMQTEQKKERKGKMSKKFASLTDEEKEYIRTAYESKVPNRVIAVELGISEYTLTVWIKKLGLAPKRPPKKITSDISDKIYELWERGCTKKKIAEELGISKHSVSHHLKIRYGENAVKQYNCTKIKKMPIPYVPNPSEPTELTKTLVKNYYERDIAKGMTHVEAVDDIHYFLGRDCEYIYGVLKESGVIA